MKVFKFIMKNFLVILSILLLSSQFLYSQGRGKKREPNPDEAKDNFSLGNYVGALDEYLLMLHKDAKNVLFNYRVGICYLNTNIDKSKAVHHLEYVTKQPKCEDVVWYELGRAYHYAYRFDDAIAAYNKYKELVKGKSGIMEEVERSIEMSYNAKELVKFPLQITWENLGKDVNSEYPDYNPFIDEMEGYLVFSTKRKGTSGGFTGYDGHFTSDIFYSEEKLGKWSKVKNLGTKCNATGNDEVVSMSTDQNFLFIYTEDENFAGDILVAKKKSKSFDQKAILDANINTNNIEVGASIYLEGDILFFNSDKSGGLGGMDIYMARKLPTGQWAIPINLGPNINTKFDEEYPVITADGKTLYFASKGHSSMGGLDIFKSIWNDEKKEWGPAINLGYPINTPDDNMTISFTSTGRHAYVSSVREGGFGNLDIYRITFSEVEASHTALRGGIKTNIPIDYNEYKEFYYYQKNGKVVEFPDEYKPDSDTTWKFVEKKKVIVKDGFEYKTMAVYAKPGEDPNAISIKLADGTEQLLKEIKSVLVKKANYTPPPADRPEVEVRVVQNTSMTLIDQSTGELFGNYTPVPSTGRYIVIAPPGVYLLEVEADGFKPYKKEIQVLDKGSFKDEIETDIFMESLNPASQPPSDK